MRYHAELDRISVVKTVVHVTKQTSAEESFTLRFIYDTMTGHRCRPLVPDAELHQHIGGGHRVTPGEMPTKKFSDTRVTFGVD